MILDNILELPPNRFIPAIKLLYNDALTKFSATAPFELKRKELKEIGGVLDTINRYCAESDNDLLEDKTFRNFITQLPISIVVELDIFTELLTHPKSGSQLKAFISKYEHTKPESLIMLIKRGLVEAEQYFHDQIFFESLFELDKSVKVDQAKAFYIDQLITYITSLSDTDFMSFMKDRTDSFKGKKLTKRIFNEDRFHSFVSNDWDITVFPKKLIKANQDLVIEYLNNHTDEPEVYEPLLDKLKGEAVLQYCVEQVVDYSQLTVRSDVKKIIQQDMERLPFTQSPDIILRFIDDLYEMKMSKVEQFFSSIEIPKSIKLLVAQPSGIILLKNKSDYARFLYLEGFINNDDLKTFILYNLLPLLNHNPPNIAYAAFVHMLYERFAEDHFTLDKSLMDLFPSCGTVYGRPDLSCEAVYWQKADIFLCRGKQCKHPKVIPDTSHNLHKYTMFDWLKLYGIDYLLPGKPKKDDFAHRLAGYFNRIKDIADRLVCWECERPLIPNFKYARTKYREFDVRQKQMIEKDMAAAYRVTVFHCNNPECAEHKIDIYISHCLGFNCPSIIDARELTKRCDNGLYVCEECGSCCSKHADRYKPGNKEGFDNRFDDMIPPIEAYDDR
jgi:hypothetical protein